MNKQLQYEVLLSEMREMKGNKLLDWTDWIRNESSFYAQSLSSVQNGISLAAEIKGTLGLNTFCLKTHTDLVSREGTFIFFKSLDYVIVVKSLQTYRR